MARLRRRSQEQFGVPLNQRKGPPPGPDVLPWYWHPGREGVTPPPAAFDRQLKAIDPDLAVCYSPAHERWILWVKNARILNDLCRGWQLLMMWEHPVTKAYLPLSELVFHNLFYISRKRWPNAEAYYDRINADIQREKAARMKRFQDDRQTEQREFYQGLRPSNIGSGSKVQMYGSGTVVPSPGDLAHRNATRKQRLPSAFIKAEQDDKEKQFYGRD